jgi:DNA-directed RNA polymerase specialized sigma24 family protein
MVTAGTTFAESAISTMREPEDSDFERLMRESYRLVYQVAYSVLGNAADAEEVAQDTFLTAYGSSTACGMRINFGLGLPAPVGGWL